MHWLLRDYPELTTFADGGHSSRVGRCLYCTVHQPSYTLCIAIPACQHYWIHLQVSTLFTDYRVVVKKKKTLVLLSTLCPSIFRTFFRKEEQGCLPKRHQNHAYCMVLGISGTMVLCNNILAEVEVYKGWGNWATFYWSHLHVMLSLMMHNILPN